MKVSLNEHTNNIIGSQRDSKPLNNLNRPITLEEIESEITLLKNGKSASEDLINNEMLKSLSDSMTNLLLKLLNSWIFVYTHGLTAQSPQS